MKIALVCSHGGHFTEMLHLVDAFLGHDVFFITYKSQRTAEMPYRKYLLKDIGRHSTRLLLSIPTILRILIKERVDVIVSTGSEIAIPIMFLGKILGCKTIFIESLCRIKGLSPTGKIVYRVTDLFLVQWEELSNKHDKLEYWGSIL
jgi:UDP-N-acetylglucosamine:LPS N-acetylglucosamine transferase